jgi:hypothetical protein
MILNIYSGITLPWGFINSMAAPTLTRFTEKMTAYLAQIVESNISWILLHLRKYVIYFTHIIIVSLMVSLSTVIFKVIFKARGKYSVLSIHRAFRKGTFLKTASSAGSKIGNYFLSSKVSPILDAKFSSQSPTFLA